MPIRFVPFVTGEYYHLYNRGVAKQSIFTRDSHYLRLERTLNFYIHAHHKIGFSTYLRKNPQTQQEYLKSLITEHDYLVEIVAYCFMPNHYHLLVKQLKDNGISRYMSQVGNSYTRYFNTTLFRVGSVFQGQFKSTLIESNNQLIHTSRYIHLNPYVSGLVTKGELGQFQYSSYNQFTTGYPSNTLIVNPKIILDQFPSRKEYQNFCLDHADYAYSTELMKHQFIDIGE